jgi:hypothetical protein
MPDKLLILDKSTFSTLDESTAPTLDGSTRAAPTPDGSTLLTLDETIYNWVLSLSYKTPGQNIENVDVPISGHARSALDTPTPRHTTGRSKSDILLLITASRLSLPVLTSRATGRSSAPSVRVVENVSRDLASVEKEPAQENPVVSDGGLSDCDEMNGQEQLVAVNSPIKSGRRLNSEVSMLFIATTVTL